MGEESAMWRELLPAVIIGIVGVVVLVVGAVTSSVTSGIGYYILGTFNKSGINIPGGSGGYNFLEAVSPILSTVFTLLGVALLVIAAIIAIVFLFKTIGVMKREAQV